MDDFSAALTSCDREPIHIPGAIQPFGVMLIVDDQDVVVGEAGSPVAVLGESLERLIGKPGSAIAPGLPASGILVVGEVSFNGGIKDCVAYRSGAHLVVELTDKTPGEMLDAAFLAQIETLGGWLEQSTNLEDLSTQAAKVFQELTGYSRVMVYRFIDGDAGVVLGESISDDSSSFLNHHFPASDIPKQARALYVRNKVRVIADVHYTPAPVRSASTDLSEIDMSDSTVRSVSPVHLQYLKNMGVGASASMSIVNDNMLWGLIACHHHEPRPMSLTTRLACQAVASALARQVKARDDRQLFRERIRLRGQEDVVVARLGSDERLVDFFAGSGNELAGLLQADGFAAVQGKDLFCIGKCPAEAQVRAVAEFVREPGAIRPIVTSSLGGMLPEAKVYADVASGLLAVTMSTEVPTILMWFRAEQLQVVKWAGNPHKDVAHSPDAQLQPRTSFEAWSESVKGRSSEWTHAEVESAQRIVRLMLEARNNRRMRQLNRELTTSLRENQILVEQKDYLLKEVNHRVQNSLSLVAAFLRMQGRTAGPEAREQLEAAEQRLMAVGLVHRRLYQDDSVRVVDLSRYLTELVAELQTSLDDGWSDTLETDLAPVLISTDRAVRVGLVVNELITNATKYAYDGRPGPLHIRLDQFRDSLRLVVSDRGKGPAAETQGTGFGSRMLASLVQTLSGTIEREDNRPGLKVSLTAPVMEPMPVTPDPD
ncbi:histidine kinase dimerization/phosphoacceptor domain -containing protein [Devosia sediminis]|uniref:histidine kinase n=1 Tax=Devosia sediminis TaxID=2798801 RepID=A0A934J2Z0_9HYPH|nr:histidine kinase dimerization/phosphoacceptor domain -containing protein [Devosia sediminis]MBJ3786719.1 GAF domain-containing protein [Devosia sediminis]